MIIFSFNSTPPPTIPVNIHYSIYTQLIEVNTVLFNIRSQFAYYFVGGRPTFKLMSWHRNAWYITGVLWAEATDPHNYTNYKVWGKITWPPFPNWTVKPTMDTLFYPTLYNGCNYLSMLGLKLNHVSKGGPCTWRQQTQQTMNRVHNSQDILRAVNMITVTS